MVVALPLVAGASMPSTPLTVMVPVLVQVRSPVV
jgi:hypothetical protein